MSKKKKVIVMTSLGPVPFEDIKECLPKDITAAVEYLKDKIQKIEAKEAEVKGCRNPNVMDYVNKLAEKKGWKPQKMARYLDDLTDINPSAVFSILLKEIAIDLDRKYKDHINNCTELFVVSLLDGRIHKVPRAYIKNFRNFAAFRTEEDAKIACNILRTELKGMFESGRK